MSFLDTSFMIDLLREEKRRTRGPAHQKLEQLSFTPVRLSLFVVCELEAGASLSVSKKNGNRSNFFANSVRLYILMIAWLRYTGMFLLISNAREYQLA